MAHRISEPEQVYVVVLQRRRKSILCREASHSDSRDEAKTGTERKGKQTENKMKPQGKKERAKWRAVDLIQAFGRSWAPDLLLDKSDKLCV